MKIDIREVLINYNLVLLMTCTTFVQVDHVLSTSHKVYLIGRELDVSVCISIVIDVFTHMNVCRSEKVSRNMKSMSGRRDSPYSNPIGSVIKPKARCSPY
jgi:hypothetical protein